MTEYVNPYTCSVCGNNGSPFIYLPKEILMLLFPVFIMYPNEDAFKNGYHFGGFFACTY